MTDQITQPVLDDNFLDDVTTITADLNRRQNWTDLRMVKLGAYAPDGVFRVPVPAAYRRYKSENYYTELDNSGWGTCINTKTAEWGGLKVKIGHPPDDKDRWYVQDVVIDNEINPVTSQSGVPNHSEFHSLRNVGHNGAQTTGHVGSDVELVDDRQMWQCNIFPYSGFQARITPGWLNYGGKMQYWDGAILTDQTANVPAGAGDAAWVLVERASDGTMTYTKGTEFEWATQNQQTDYVPKGADNTAQWAILVRNGDTSFTYACIWNLSMARQVQGPPQTAISAAANTSGPGTYYVDCSGGAITLTLDSDDCVNGRRITVKDQSGDAAANNITIDTEGAETINGGASTTISTNYGTVTLEAYSDEWYIV